MKSKHVILAIIHSYMPNKDLDPYFSGLLDGFSKSGVDVHLILANDLVNGLDAHGLKNEISETKLIEYINELNPVFIFSSNRAGITKEILGKTSCPIITWMVDLMPFMHHGGDHSNLFCERDYLITSTYKSVEMFESIYPVLKGRVIFLPVATSIDEFKTCKIERQDINISFVGSLFSSEFFVRILNTYKESPELIAMILKLAERIKVNHYLDIERNMSELKLNRILKDFSVDAHLFKALISNAVSNHDRIKLLDAVCDLGLKLYGTDNWTDMGHYSLNLMKAFQFNQRIDTRKKLVEIYQRSKISVNISHNQALDGLPYRIFDIMASNSMLITNYRKNSDLFHLFGKNFPVPMYRDEVELRSLVNHYLKNESERIQLVKICQQAVATGFSFADRARQIFGIIGDSLSLKFENGKLLRIKIAQFKKPFYERFSSDIRKDEHVDAVSKEVKNEHVDAVSKEVKNEHVDAVSKEVKTIFFDKIAYWLLNTIRWSTKIMITLIIDCTSQNQRLSAKRWVRALTTHSFRSKIDVILYKVGIVRSSHNFIDKP